MRLIITALIALTALGGVASADRYRGDHHRRNNGGVRVERSYRTYPRQSYRTYSSSRYVVRPQVRVVRQPIYVQRPVIRYRYYNYYQRPSLLVESYPSKAGYYWVAGQWQWSGYEWIWQPGHYEPDTSYGTSYDSYDGSQYGSSYPSSGYDSSYPSSGYYDSYGNWITY